MESILSDLQSYIPAQIDFAMVLKFVALSAAGALAIGLFNRLVLGKRSDLNHAVSSAMGILFVYAVTIVIYSLNPGKLAQYLTPLPFIRFSGDKLVIFSFFTASLPEICRHVLSLLILSFLVNLLDSFIPKGKKFLGWYGYRFLTVIMAMALHFVVSWLFGTYLPGFLVTYAPMILLVLLGALLLLGAAKVVLGLVLTVVNPIIGAIYAFFFSHAVGKQLSKAVVTSALICALVLVVDYLGYTVISVSVTALVAYIPVILVLLALWYLVGHVL